MQQARLLHLLTRRLGNDGARAQLIETDISWIRLTADLAYKFKKAIRRDVLDYGSLAARRVACEEELRLNRRFAPELYLGLASVSGSCSRPVIDGTGTVLEVAVRLRRFAQCALWQARLAARARAGGDPSDADQAVLAYQMTHAGAQGLSADELDEAVAVTNDGRCDGEALAALASRLRERLQRQARASPDDQGTLLLSDRQAPVQ
ncbi:MAG: hypothetical protein RSH52_00330 [Janthinobacterium sp.]